MQAAEVHPGRGAGVRRRLCRQCGGARRRPGGRKVLLVEKAPFAGGIITSVGLPYFDGIAHIRTKRVVVRGIALELLSKSGVCRPDARTVAKHNPTIPNTFEFKLLLDRLFRGAKGQSDRAVQQLRLRRRRRRRPRRIGDRGQQGRPGDAAAEGGDRLHRRRRRGGLGRAPLRAEPGGAAAHAAFSHRQRASRTGGWATLAAPPWRRRSSGASCRSTTGPA